MRLHLRVSRAGTDAELSFRLQLISSELGAFFIRLFGIPVYLTGNVIDLGNYKLQVVEACSGLRYLYPLLSLGFLAAYLFQAPLWQRALVFLSAIPITIVMNSFRIGMVGLLVDRWGTAQAEGVLHFFEGWVIFIACAAILAVEIWLLARFGSGKSFFEVFRLPTVNCKFAASALSLGRPRLLPVVACLVLLVCSRSRVLLSLGRQEIVPERLRFVSFPVTLGRMAGASDPCSSRRLSTRSISKTTSYRITARARTTRSISTSPTMPRSEKAIHRIHQSSAFQGAAGK